MKKQLQSQLAELCLAHHIAVWLSFVSLILCSLVMRPNITAVWVFIINAGVLLFLRYLVTLGRRA